MKAQIGIHVFFLGLASLLRWMSQSSSFSVGTSQHVRQLQQRGGRSGDCHFVWYVYGGQVNLCFKFYLPSWALRSDQKNEIVDKVAKYVSSARYWDSPIGTGWGAGTSEWKLCWGGSSIWSGCLWTPPWGGVRGPLNWEETSGQTLNTLEGLYIPTCLGWS